LDSFHSIFKSPISNFIEISSVGAALNFTLVFLTRVGLPGGDESSDSECCTPGERILENSMFRVSLGGLLALLVAVMNATTLGRFHYRELNPRCSASSHSLY
jgi:hypothetical protein